MNPRHADFQSAALPTELPDHVSLLSSAKNYSTCRPKCGQVKNTSKIYLKSGKLYSIPDFNKSTVNDKEFKQAV